TAALLRSVRLVPASSDQLGRPEAVAANTKAVGVFVPIELIRNPGRMDLLVAGAARFPSAKAHPHLGRVLGRQSTGVESPSHLLGERYVLCFHAPLSEQRSVTRYCH